MKGDRLVIRDRPSLYDYGLGSKIAFTVAFFSMVKVHTFVVSSLQGLPVHLTKVEPTPALAVKVTRSIQGCRVPRNHRDSL